MLNKKFVYSVLFTILFGLVILTSCSTKNNDGGINGSMYNEGNDTLNGIFTDDELAGDDIIMRGEDYNDIIDNNFIYTNSQKASYFSMDSFTASYSNLRRYINSGQALNANVIKTDELINYFSYDLEQPEEGETFKITAEMGKCAWSSNQLLTIAVKTKEADLTTNEGNNLVFLIDVSGSMSGSKKIDLLKEGFIKLLDTLSANDRISIVTYASGVKTYAEGVYADEKESLKKIINSLTPKGATYASGGIQKAYEIAEKYFIPGGNNRIIIATDGDFNVGISNQDELKTFITEKAQSGVYLTTLGFGMGNYRDTTLETLAKNGNGNYAYIDSSLEIEKVLVDELSKTLVTVAKDVKSKVEFNPDIVDSYRLIGYENKLLTEDDFNDENKDAGEIGSGHTTIIVYEIVLKPEIDNSIDSIKEYFNVQINYKDPKSNESLTKKASFDERVIKDELSENHQFVSCLVEFALILKNSNYRGTANYTSLVERLEELECVKEDKFKNEFLSLVKIAKSKNLIANPEYNATLVRLTLIYENGYIILTYKKDTEITPQLIESFIAYDDTKYQFVLAYDADFVNLVTSHKLETSLTLYIRLENLNLES